jgi:spermidine synthase
MFGRKVLYTGSSRYGSYKIIEGPYNERKARVLYGADRTPQSGAALDDNPELLFNYNQRIMEIVASIGPKRVLVIGGGVMMLPIAVYERFAGTAIDVVEIDALLIKLAYQYFNAPTDSRLTTYAVDGKDYLKKTTQRYDVIILDAFSGHDIPKHLLEKTASDLYAQHLNENGVLAINLISAVQSKHPRLVAEVLDTLLKTFDTAAVFQADSNESLREEQNLVVTASNGSMDFDYLQSVDVKDKI